MSLLTVREQGFLIGYALRAPIPEDDFSWEPFFNEEMNFTAYVCIERTFSWKPVISENCAGMTREKLTEKT